MSRTNEFQKWIDSCPADVKTIEEIREITKRFPPFDELNEPCMFDSLPARDRGKPMLLCCPCPKCSPRC